MIGTGHGGVPERVVVPATVASDALGRKSSEITVAGSGIFVKSWRHHLVEPGLGKNADAVEFAAIDQRA